MQELKSQKLKPLIIILEEVPSFGYESYEYAWIYRLRGHDLLNGIPGKQARWRRQPNEKPAGRANAAVEQLGESS